MTSAIHVSLHTADLEASVDFYQRFLGTDPIKERPGYAKFELASPGLNLTLNQVADAPKPGISHLGIQVPASSEVWKRRGQVESTGLTTRTEEGVDCCYAVQDKFWVTDPNGVEWEVFTVLDDAGVVASAAACCAPECCD